MEDVTMNTMNRKIVLSVLFASCVLGSTVSVNAGLFSDIVSSDETLRDRFDTELYMLQEHLPGYLRSAFYAVSVMYGNIFEASPLKEVIYR